ncbi:ribonuclease domain-containing protein [Youngiibacter multivorans]|uniref:Ribonuclease n=1 Tax=Youngiibacter multivorans TaxID=937251 RepID=A0ABS4FZU5_9CLOT|nr:ribonuclease domain-containing protein [Youngiibacter multivorans]MBP1917777.1 guanyl-specific ribonuclease Sa [Youngiibacter multivorans]
MKRLYRMLTGLLVLMLMTMTISGCASQTEPSNGTTPTKVTVPSKETVPSKTEEAKIKEEGHYYTKNDVAEYIHLYGKLPENFITKNEAEDLGWVASKGNLWEVSDKLVIGGDKFGNREGLLPKASGRVWYECDVNYEGGFRGDDRIVFSNDGLIYFTSDHYASFKKLY